MQLLGPLFIKRFMENEVQNPNVQVGCWFFVLIFEVTNYICKIFNNGQGHWIIGIEGLRATVL